MPSQTSVEPLDGVMVTRGTLTTSAKGQSGWAKSASLWTGWERGGDVGVGGRAVFAEMKERRGLGPRREVVRWVASGLRRMVVSQWGKVRGGSCWMFLGGDCACQFFSRERRGMERETEGQEEEEEGGGGESYPLL